MDWNRLRADRTRTVEFSGIRKFFEKGLRMADPCDLSIGMPDYDAPEELKAAAIRAIQAGHNRYTPTAGLPTLHQRLSADVKREFGRDHDVLVTSGVSGGLALALLAAVDPGDEVIFADPYFISYLQLVRLVGGVPKPIPTYPDFRLDAETIASAVTPRTKAIILNSPGNPTGRVMTEGEARAVAEIALQRDLLLISDEIYDRLCYDGSNPCVMKSAPENCVVLRGFGKTYGITGWRMGYAAGPASVIQEMTKLHQFTYVCAPSMAQYAVLEGMDTDVSRHLRDYRAKRDLVCALLAPCFEFTRPGGGFYVFPRAPARFAGGTAFADAACEQGVLVIPGNVFSSQDTHFRISYAASDAQLRRGCETLCKLARC